MTHLHDPVIDSSSLGSAAELPPARHASTGEGPRQTAQDRQERRRGLGFILVVLSLSLLTWAEWVWQPLTFTWDPNDERCLPDFHAGMLLRGGLDALKPGDLVYWRPSGPLSYVKQTWVLKQVGAVAGDHLQIKGEQVFVNGQALVSGLPLRNIYRKRVQDLQRDEIVPPGKVFVIGTHPRSDDSRYWGYMDKTELLGRGYRFW